MVVFRSNKGIYAQIIDDDKRVTLVAANSLKLTSKKAGSAEAVGKKIAEDALGKKIKKVVFDRGGYIFTGRVKALAEAARKTGLEF